MSSFNKQTLINYLGGVKKLIGIGSMGDENLSTGLPSFVKEYLEYDERDDSPNGLCLNNIYIPEEVMLQILMYIEPQFTLKYSRVCYKWNKLIKSYVYWSDVYKSKYRKKAKKLPWYLYYSLLSTNYFNTNLIVNGNGQNQFNNWTIVLNGGDRFKIEPTPQGADLLPTGVPEFQGHTSCFATSYTTSSKKQEVKVTKNRLFRYILDYYKPHIYLSEWTSGRFDCGSIYKLSCKFKTKDEAVKFDSAFAINPVEQWAGKSWRKIEITVTQYPEEIEKVIFEHEGRDTQFWAGHYGSKMAGGVLMFLFDSIEPLPLDDNEQVVPKTYKKIEYTSNSNATEEQAQLLFPPHYHYVDLGGDYEWQDEDEGDN